MLEINKRQNAFGHCFTISTDEGQFEISFQGNLDLYWRNLYHGSILDQPATKSFNITKENYYLYSLFEELYENIKNCNIFTLSELDILFCKDEEEIETKKRDNEKSNNDLKERQKYNPNRLFNNRVIEWHCDDLPYDKASIVKIEQKEDTYIVTFEKSKDDNNLNYSVRFRNSGSRYEPFNIIFMKMYNKLKEYNPEYHQISFDEYLYQKKLERKK